ncbi:MAG: branched-chain amino acid ABC transporter permease [Clostridiales Family XIII bacterium]|nr:branched-chain amino acid ABC transporter permease [Clostridiales Family XIII bacterium]
MKTEYGVFAVVLAVLFVLPLTGAASDNAMRIAFNIALYAVFAQMWNLMCGYAGLLSLGQQMFIGVSGYATAVVCTSYGMPFVLGLLVSGVVSALLALFLSVLLLRMRGLYFAIATWIVSEMIKILFTGWKLVNYAGGMTIRVTPYPTLSQQFMLILALAAASFLLVQAMLRSKIGLGLAAMRDDPDAAAGLGVNIFKMKTLCFTVCGFVTGIGGSIAYLNRLSVFPNGAFAIDWTIAIVFAVIIGGTSTATGPIVGAFVYVLLFNFLSRYAGYSNIILGVIAIAVIVVAPKGIMGTLQNRFKFELFSSTRPSLD